MDWPFVSGSWSGITAGSGSNPNPEKDPLSASRSPTDNVASDVRRHVLIVEDNESDVFLIERALLASEVAVSVQVVKDGEEAVRFFDLADTDPSKPCPDVVILDINLPKKQGGEVLKHMRRSSRCAKAHVIVVSTSDSVKDREQMAQLGADGYFRKPSDFDAFMKLGDIIRALFGPKPAQ